MLNLDSSLFFVIGLVWILMIIIEKIYLRPMRNIVEQREQKIEDESGLIESMTRQIKEQTGMIENAIKEAELDSAVIKEELIKEGEKARTQIVIDTRENSKEMFTEKMTELEKDIAAAEKQLEKEIEVYSRKIKEIFI
jgi:F0F1-type ATP synthase membrane subunit b/b'